MDSERRVENLNQRLDARHVSSTVHLCQVNSYNRAVQTSPRVGSPAENAV